MSDHKALERIHWHCRRGMLELDLFLLPFFEKVYTQLDEAEQREFCRLLEYPDPDIYNWLMGAIEPEDEGIKTIVNRIRQHAKQPTRH